MHMYNKVFIHMDGDCNSNGEISPVFNVIKVTNHSAKHEAQYGLKCDMTS